MPVKISTLRSFHAFFHFHCLFKHPCSQSLFHNSRFWNYDPDSYFFACMLTKNTDVKKSVCDINIRNGPTSLLTWPWNKWCITFCKFWHLWGGCCLLNENFTGVVHFKVRRQRKFVFNLNFILNYDNYIPILDDNMD